MFLENDSGASSNAVSPGRFWWIQTCTGGIPKSFGTAAQMKTEEGI
jgi:hypothetical protein